MNTLSPPCAAYRRVFFDKIGIEFAAAAVTFLVMRLCWLILLSGCLASGALAQGVEGRVIKVLPQFLDKQGRHALTPSLFDRDAYQALLRRTPAKRSALRFAVEWKARAPESETLKLRVEMRGDATADSTAPPTLEMEVRQRHSFSHWAYLKLREEDYRKLGEVTAWRVTLWDGGKLLGEQKSFLW